MNPPDPGDRPSRLVHFTPLRYPGGKGKLANYVKRLLRANGLTDGDYVEPYAGGAAIALELLLQEYVSRIHINDVSRPVYAFWRSILEHTDEFCRLLIDTPRSVGSWEVQKRIFANQSDFDILSLGFATFFLNRTNRSGILNGGMIGGRDQTGPWKIDARYNARELATRVCAIANMRKRISVTGIDALKFLKQVVRRWPAKTLIYLDPPYYSKGRELYYDFYLHDDHDSVARFVSENVLQQRWIVSYDDVPEVRDFYRMHRRISYHIGYSARAARQGAEAMFFCDVLQIPPLDGAMKPVPEQAHAVL